MAAVAIHIVIIKRENSAAWNKPCGNRPLSPSFARVLAIDPIGPELSAADPVVDLPLLSPWVDKLGAGP